MVVLNHIGNDLVLVDSTYPHRWLDAFGPNVVKIVEDFQGRVLSAADTPLGWTVTLVEAGGGETTLAPADAELGGALLITTDGNEDDGANLQVAGELFSFASAYRTYFGIRYKLNATTQNDFIAGLCITDTTLLGGMTDGIYFRKVDASTSVSFVIEKDSVETEVAGVDTQAANTYAWLEFTYDGTYIGVYVDGVKVTQLTAANFAAFPNDEYLTPSFQLLAGEAVAKTATIDKIVAIQIQTT